MRHVTKKLQRILAVALSVAMLIPSNISVPLTVSANEANSSSEAEQQFTETNADSGGASTEPTILPDTTTEYIPEVTTEYDTEASTEDSASTESSTETTEEDSEDESGEDDADPLPVPEGESEYELIDYGDRIFEPTDSPADVLEMARHGLDLSYFFRDTVFVEMTVEELEGYVASNMTFEDILVLYYPFLTELDPAELLGEEEESLTREHYSPARMRTLTRAALGLPDQLSSAYICQSVSSICTVASLNSLSGAHAGETMWKITMYQNVTGFCMSPGKSMSATTATTGSRYSYNGTSYSESSVYGRICKYYSNNPTTTRYTAAQLCIWMYLLNGSLTEITTSSADYYTIEYSHMGDVSVSDINACIAYANDSSNAGYACALLKADSGTHQDILVWNKPTVSEQYYASAFKWRKTDAVTGADVTDAVFSVQQWNGSAWETMQEGITYSNGGYQSTGLKLYYSPNADKEWRIVETSAGATHKMPDDPVVWTGSNVAYSSSMVSQDDANSKASLSPVDLTGTPITNNPYYGYVQISKVDSQTGNAIQSDATFTVYEYNVSSNTYQATSGTNAITFARNSAADATYRSAGGYKGDGAFCWTESNHGKYKIIESVAPSGYIGNFIAQGNFSQRVEYYIEIVKTTASGGVEYDASTHTLTVPDGQTGNLVNTTANYWSNPTGGDVFMNEAVWGKVEVVKQDKESGLAVGQQDATLDGAVYGLIPAADIPYPDGQSNVYTAVARQTVANLQNQIHLQEAVANDTSGHYSEAEVANAQAQVLALQAQLRNYCKATCTITYDAVTGKSSGVMVRNDLAGTADENKLYLGQYYLVEISPSEGYLLSTDITDVTLSYQNDTTIEIAGSYTVTEQVKKQSFQFAKLKDNNGNTELYPLDGAEFRVLSVNDLTRIDGRDTMTDDELVAAVLTQYATPEGSSLNTSIDMTSVDSALVYNENSEGGLLIATGGRNEYRVATLTSGLDGFVRSPELPYGRYLVYESKIPQENGTDIYTDISPFVVTVSDDGVAFTSGSTTSNIVLSSNRTAQKMRYFVDGTLQSYLKIIKRDADTQLDVLQNHAQYKIWDVARNRYVTTKIFYPTEYVIDTYETNDNGYLITPQSLSAGRYILEEIKAPEGYVRVGYEKYYDTTTGLIVDAPAQSLEFEISMNTDHYIDTDGNNVVVCVIYQYNEAQKGALEIYKTGERLVSTTTSQYVVSKDDVKNLRDDVNTTNTQFVYESKGLSGVTYELHVGENTIYTLDREYDWDAIFDAYPEYAGYTKEQILSMDAESLAELLPYRNVAEYNNVKLEADALVTTLTTDADGYARIGDLPIGDYYIVEVEAPGYSINSEPDEVSFTITADDTQSVHLETREYDNQRKKFDIVGFKRDTDSGEAVSGAVFGLYADEDIYDYTGQTKLVSQGDLIETAVTGADGYVNFALDAPYGVSFSMKELASPYMYIYDGSTVASFDATDAAMETDSVKKMVVGDITHVILTQYNKQYGYILVSKLSFADDTVDVPDAKLTVIYHNPNGQDEVFDSWITDGSDHKVEKELTPGQYTLVEERAPNGYYTAESIDFEIGDDLTVVKHVKMYDREAEARIKVVKLDEETQIPLKGVKFQLLDENGTVCEELVTDENGEAVTQNQYPLYTYENGRVSGKRNWILHEVDSVFGYHIVDTDVPIPDAESWTENTTMLTVTITNGPNEVRISKTSATTGVEIKGAVLTVIEKSTGKIVDSWITDGAEHVIKGMDEGTYILREKRAAFGYVVATDVEFEVKDSVVVTKVSMIDEEVMGVLKIRKVGLTGTPLPGTTFVIKDENGTVVDTLVCGDDGTAQSKPLPAFIFDADGTYLREIQYTLQETKAADGYILDDTEFPFTFSYVNDQTPIVYRSAKITNSRYPKTGDNSPLKLVMISMLIATAIGGALFFTCRKKPVPNETMSCIAKERTMDISDNHQSSDGCYPPGDDSGEQS